MDADAETGEDLSSQTLEHATPNLRQVGGWGGDDRGPRAPRMMRWGAATPRWATPTAALAVPYAAPRLAKISAELGARDRGGVGGEPPLPPHLPRDGKVTGDETQGRGMRRLDSPRAVGGPHGPEEGARGTAVGDDHWERSCECKREGGWPPKRFHEARNTEKEQIIRNRRREI